MFITESEIGDWVGSSGFNHTSKNTKYNDYDPLESILNETLKYHIYNQEYVIQKVIKKPVYKYVNKSNIPMYNNYKSNQANNNQVSGDQLVDS